MKIEQCENKASELLTYRQKVGKCLFADDKKCDEAKDQRYR